MKTDGHVLVIGASGLDSKGRSTQNLRFAADNPGSIRNSYGGVGRNIAENLARLKVKTVLLTVVGDDATGDLILAHLATVGVDTTYALQVADYRTGSFIAILDDSGDLAVAISDFEIMSQMDVAYIQSQATLFADARLVVIDLNMPVPTLEAIITQCQQYHVPLCVDPTSPAHAQKIIDKVHHFYLVTPNASEIEVFCQFIVDQHNPDSVLLSVQQVVGNGATSAIVTLGEHGVAYATSAECGLLNSAKVAVIDSTGAGDALTAGVIFGLVNNLTLAESLRLGMAAARLTLGCHEAVAPELSPDVLYEQLTL